MVSSASSHTVPVKSVFPFHRQGNELREVKLLADSHTPGRARPFEAEHPTFLLLLFVMAAEQTDL